MFYSLLQLAEQFCNYASLFYSLLQRLGSFVAVLVCVLFSVAETGLFCSSASLRFILCCRDWASL